MALLAALINLDGRPHYVQSGWFQISLANLIVVVVMIAGFALAVTVKFPGHEEPVAPDEVAGDE